MLLFLCDRTEYGVPIKENVHVYECTFSTLILNPKTEKTYRGENRVLVVCDTIEDAIAVCRKQWPDEFVLHQVVKRNQRCDLIVSDSVLGNRELESIRAIIESPVDLENDGEVCVRVPKAVWDAARSMV
jgi:hypothetical protein